MHTLDANSICMTLTPTSAVTYVGTVNSHSGYYWSSSVTTGKSFPKRECERERRRCSVNVHLYRGVVALWNTNETTFHDTKPRLRSALPTAAVETEV